MNTILAFAAIMFGAASCAIGGPFMVASAKLLAEKHRSHYDDRAAVLTLATGAALVGIGVGLVRYGWTG